MREIINKNLISSLHFFSNRPEGIYSLNGEMNMGKQHERKKKRRRHAVLTEDKLVKALIGDVLVDKKFLCTMCTIA